MQEIKIAYKVLRRLKNGKLVSAGRLPIFMRQEYVPGEWITGKYDGKGRRLYCFKSYSSVDGLKSQFTKSNVKYEDLEVWEVKVEKPKNVKVLPNVWSYVNGYDESEFNENSLEYKEILRYYKGGRTFHRIDITEAMSCACYTNKMKLIRKLG
jgi:hypothetical protein